AILETATSTDDLVVDLYGSADEQGWRIMAKGFDFSGLGSEKALLAGDNMTRLLGKIRTFASAAKFVDEYGQVAGALSAVWEVDRRKDFEGLNRIGIWKSGFSSVVSTSNLEQFSKYSRLQRVLL
ncbi:MAG: hypothetical protein HOP17_09245, partial [Acidobacteria bacterium]|nr:hypothetical protein [Acidobacteriota bacterium]